MSGERAAVSTGNEHRFVATLYKLGINRCVDVPEEISCALGGKGCLPVIANAQGLVVRTTLVPAGNARHRLFLDGKIRKQLGIDARSLVGITLLRDKNPNAVAVPPDVAAALRKPQERKRLSKALRRGCGASSFARS